MPDMMTDEGALDFNLSIDDVIEQADKKQQESKEKIDPSQELNSRISGLESDNQKLRGLLTTLVQTLNEKEKEPETDLIDEVDLEDFSNEPDKLKGAFSALEKSLLFKVEKLIETKVSPALGIIDQNAKTQQMVANTQKQVQEFFGKTPDAANYNLGMQDLVNQGINFETIGEYYTLAKRYGLHNSKYEKQSNQKKEPVERKGPRRIESDNVNLNEKKKLTTVRQIAEAFLNGELEEEAS